ncbi:MAG: hypothetical protein A2919_00550 [Candidatus Spechtbacteria bacterium RIFCSPLOWO2_01_FULL_43_12]|uniref:Membrane protein insertion efficiency factor YidD n=1 Tax=Candidatus Spechtbacteria bacterium RIFCSPLOWO2_01_FULL_43_12 TaxID=1802162 RepID=A0A1G2HEY8_9BACT|nr:MAG: hypothetical protein A2919_00550 [Candidatus Spechtbacteria bacterium RIFCSPLOWO2_01_FULL_43_12]
MPSFLFLIAITIYQWTFSPDHGVLSIYTLGQCKFRPTCSQYTKVMIKKHGVIAGAKLGFRQIRQCH